MNDPHFTFYSVDLQSAILPDFDYPFDGDDVYLPSPELAAAVNVALILGQPLLLTGEPGTGKTRLAYHLAKYFGLHGPLVFHAQTGSVKKDLFYTYDALGHFHYTQNKEHKTLEAGDMEARFIRYEALGEAIRIASEEQPRRSVVLIDEIDKAPRDLPNDLLNAIEQLAFTVPEIPGKVQKNWACPKNLPPLIIITSNSEKNLPDAFLRRVVYHHIKFPDSERVLEILQAKQLTGLKDKDLKILIDHFIDIRNAKGLGKKPATAELIAWATLLAKLRFPISKLKDPSKLDDAEQNLLRTSYGVLAKHQDDLKKLTGQ